MRTKRIDNLYTDSRKLKSQANRWTVDYLIAAGEVNADDTIYLEKAAPESDWERLAIDSIVSLLSDGGYNHHVVKFFAARGIVA